MSGHIKPFKPTLGDPSVSLETSKSLMFQFLEKTAKIMTLCSNSGTYLRPTCNFIFAWGQQGLHRIAKLDIYLACSFDFFETHKPKSLCWRQKKNISLLLFHLRTWGDGALVWHLGSRQLSLSLFIKQPSPWWWRKICSHSESMLQHLILWLNYQGGAERGE